MCGGAHGLSPMKSHTMAISSIMNTAPAIAPAQTAALQSVALCNSSCGALST